MGGTGELTGILDRAAVRRAADAAVDRLAIRTEPGLSVDVLREGADRLVQLIESGSMPWPADARVHVLERLVPAMREELVRIWTELPEPPAADVMLTTLATVDRVSAEVARRIDHGAGNADLPDGYEFSAGVAHDLRSPLTSILFLAETLHSGQSGPTNDIQRRQLGIIYSAALGLVSVASDIIEMVRGGDGLTEREPALFSVTEILESVRDIVRPMAEEKNLGVHLFPPAVDHRYGYPLALSRVLLNLTTNALKFTDGGFVEIAVRSTSPTRLEFSVRDTGKGYSPEALETLYEPMRRLRAGNRFGFSGTGLGLAISRKLVSAMGSTLDVETRPKWGSRFFFEVELPPGPDSQPPRAA
jgi:signal transduction histidine kinase